MEENLCKGSFFLPSEKDCLEDSAANFVMLAIVEWYFFTQAGRRYVSYLLPDSLGAPANVWGNF